MGKDNHPKSAHLRTNEKTVSLSLIPAIRKEKKVKVDLPNDIIRPSNERTFSSMVLNWQYSQQSAAAKLCYAARWGQIPMLQRLLAKCPEPVNRCEALTTACLYGNIEIVKILVNEYNADVNFKYQDEYPIYNAICNSNPLRRLEIIDFLIENGANIHHQSGSFNETAIQTCLRYLNGYSGKINADYIPVLKRLIDAGGKVHEPHSLSNCSLANIYAQKMAADPAIFKQIEDIISGGNAVDDGLASLMSRLQFQPNSMDSLLIAFAQLSTEPRVTATSSSRPN